MPYCIVKHASPRHQKLGLEFVIHNTKSVRRHLDLTACLFFYKLYIHAIYCVLHELLAYEHYDLCFTKTCMAGTNYKIALTQCYYVSTRKL